MDWMNNAHAAGEEKRLQKAQMCCITHAKALKLTRFCWLRHLRAVLSSTSLWPELRSEGLMVLMVPFFCLLVRIHAVCTNLSVKSEGTPRVNQVLTGASMRAVPADPLQRLGNQRENEFQISEI